MPAYIVRLDFTCIQSTFYSICHSWWGTRHYFTLSLLVVKSPAKPVCSVSTVFVFVFSCLSVRGAAQFFFASGTWDFVPTDLTSSKPLKALFFMLQVIHRSKLLHFTLYTIIKSEILSRLSKLGRVSILDNCKDCT